MITDIVKPYGHVYKITNNITGKSYIGQSTNVFKRFKRYKGLHCKEQPKIFRSFNKHGIDNFTFDIINVAWNKPQLDYFECYYIKKYDTVTNGYNLSSGGSNGKHSVETKKKMSISQKGNKNSLGHKNNLGHKHTEASRQKISLSLKGNKRHLGHKRSEL